MHYSMHYRMSHGSPGQLVVSRFAAFPRRPTSCQWRHRGPIRGSGQSDSGLVILLGGGDFVGQFVHSAGAGELLSALTAACFLRHNEPRIDNDLSSGESVFEDYLIIIWSSKGVC